LNAHHHRIPQITRCSESRHRRRINQPGDFFNGIGAERKCWHGSLPAAIGGIPENIRSSRAFLGLTDAVEKCGFFDWRRGLPTELRWRLLLK
jgi:hypothetical protein